MANRAGNDGAVADWLLLHGEFDRLEVYANRGIIEPTQQLRGMIARARALLALCRPQIQYMNQNQLHALQSITQQVTLEKCVNRYYTELLDKLAATVLNQHVNVPPNTVLSPARAPYGR